MGTRPYYPLTKVPTLVRLVLYRLIHAALPYLTKSGAGRVVNIASTEAIFP